MLFPTLNDHFMLFHELLDIELRQRIVVCLLLVDGAYLPVDRQLSLLRLDGAIHLLVDDAVAVCREALLLCIIGDGEVPFLQQRNVKPFAIRCALMRLP